MTSQAVTSEIDALLTRADDLLRRFDPPHVSHLAIPLLRRAVAAAPEQIDLHFRLARALHRIGDGAGARAVCDGILSRWPEAVEARLFRAIAWIPILYDHEDQILPARAAFLAGIEDLAGHLAGNADAARRLAAHAGQITPYYLPYAGLNDVVLQRAYGEVMAGAMAVAYPDLAARPAMPPVDGRIRVGIASRHFYRQSNWRSILRGWMRGLDPARFAIHAYHMNDREDECTEEARGLATRFVSGVRSFEDWAGIIRADRLHILLHPSVGSFQDTTRLAMLRLATVQAVAVGHCTTSGLPTMDYVLSGDLAEPVDAASHYTERLVRLPGLGFNYSRPLIGQPQRDRADFGLRPGATVFLSPNTVVKYLPQYDVLYPQIAARSGDCQIVFVLSSRLEAISRRFVKRMKTAFATAGVDADRHLVFLPRLDMADYHDLQRHADIYLDAIGWTGGTSTAMALGHGLPTVTLAGDVFRSRMGMAMLQVLGLRDYVADTPDGFVDRAVRLAAAPDLRVSLRDRILAGAGMIYDDPAVPAALSAFIERAVAERSGGAEMQR